MKRSMVLILVLLVLCSSAYAADHVRLAYDGGYENQTADLEFYVLRECPEPELIYGATMGWEVKAVGDATWEFNSSTAGLEASMWFNLGGILFTEILDNVSPDTLLTGAAAMPPAGMPIFHSEVLWCKFNFTWGDIAPGGYGEVCFDSVIIWERARWKWSGLTCGTTGAPDRPAFTCGSAADTVWPCCFPVEEIPIVPPEINVTPPGDIIETDICGTAAFHFEADPGMFGPDPGTIVGWTVISGIGTIDNDGNYNATVGPSECGTYDVCIQVENDIGGTDEYCFQVPFINQDPYFVNCPNEFFEPPWNMFEVYQGASMTVTLSVGDPDPCQDLNIFIDNMGFDGDLPFNGNVELVGNQLTINTADTDGDIQVEVVLRVMDDQGAWSGCVVAFNILSSEPFEIRIEKLHNVHNGHYAWVPIYLTKGSEYFGGFDFLIAYDASALTLMGAELGWWFDGCYEYFTYRHSWTGNCGGPCPSGLLRVVGIADINNGPNHPDPFCLVYPGPSGYPYEMVALSFYVTTDFTYECMYVPIRFFWHDCGDNTLSNIMGDTLFISDHVYDFEGNEVTGDIHYGGHWWLGDCENDDPDKPSGLPFIDFIHGGVDIICIDSVDDRGDINQNEIPYEIADAVIFTNYFIYGVQLFPFNAAATDINNDGRILTVGDLVYLVRIITGDARPIPKLSPYANSVEITFGEVVASTSAVEIGAALFIFDGEVDVELLADRMKLKSDLVANQTRVLVWSDDKNCIASGNTEILAVAGTAPLVKTEVSDYYGNLMTVSIVEKILPSGFALEQNYPNPFNASTDITIFLPDPSPWKLDIYNAAGQLVESFSGYGVDEVTVTWNAAGVSSGVYFYKAIVGRHNATKKMVLMK